MKVAREGQQSGDESTALVELVPWFARSLRTLGIFARSAAAWSSVITTRMFGRPSLAALAGRAWATEVRARRRSAVVARDAATRRRGGWGREGGARCSKGPPRPAGGRRWGGARAERTLSVTRCQLRLRSPRAD